VTGNSAEGFLHRRMSMSEYHRTPRADVVSISIAVGIRDIRSGGITYKDRRAAYCAKGAHGAVDAARYYALRPLE
jgi:hypothetical protein